jgi:hypothetical protein
MRFAGTLLLLALSSPLSAQELSREQLETALEAYRRILLDWGGLTRYGSENAELKPQPGRVVFLGDEITENWGPEFFPGKPYLNRGITRQTVAQMLVRFRQDVISLKPAVVVIQAGTNDLASVMGPSTEGTMADHFMSMVELAKDMAKMGFWADADVALVQAWIKVCPSFPTGNKKEKKRMKTVAEELQNRMLCLFFHAKYIFYF